MKIYPAVDIKDGKCVRLKMGNAADKTVYFENPLDAAKSFADAGSDAIHVVDLDGAFSGESANLPAISRIAALGMFVELGGGLRDEASVRRAFDARRGARDNRNQSVHESGFRGRPRRKVRRQDSCRHRRPRGKGRDKGLGGSVGAGRFRPRRMPRARGGRDFRLYRHRHRRNARRPEPRRPEKNARNPFAFRRAARGIGRGVFRKGRFGFSGTCAFP